MVEVIFGAKSSISKNVENRLPLLQGTLPENTISTAITFYEERASDAQKLVAPPKPHFFEKKNRPPKHFAKKSKQEI